MLCIHALMKRLLTGILAIIYLSFSAGATVHLHYCMGEFVNYSLFEEHDGTCGKCGMEKHESGNGCCKDVSVVFKSDEKYIPVQPAYDFPVSLATITHASTDLLSTIIFQNNSPKNLYPDFVPPGINCPIYIMGNSFLI